MSTQAAPTAESEGSSAHLICHRANAAPRPIDCLPACLATSPSSHHRRQSLSSDQSPMLAMVRQSWNLAVRRLILPRHPAHQAAGYHRIPWNSRLTHPPYQSMKYPAHTPIAPSQWTKVLPHDCCQLSSNGLTWGASFKRRCPILRWTV